MSDEESQRATVSTEEDDSKIEGESFTHFPVLKRRRGKKLSELRHPRQKFCPRWELEFPWLKSDRVDEALGWCTICSKHLVCKKSHLERHQDSFRHIRMQIQSIEGTGGADMIVEGVDGEAAEESGDNGDHDSGEATNPEFLECGNKRDIEEEDFVEYDAEFEQEIEMEHCYDATLELSPVKREAESAQQKTPLVYAEKRFKMKVVDQISPGQRTAKLSPESPAKLDRLKLLKQIDHDRAQLSDYLQERRKSQTHGTTLQQAPSLQIGQPQLPRDPFDMFFESVSASVKILPPKLAAELKSRVSQIVAEFELRAICEREAQASAVAIIALGSSAEELADTNENERRVQSKAQ